MTQGFVDLLVHRIVINYRKMAQLISIIEHLVIITLITWPDYVFLAIFFMKPRYVCLRTVQAHCSVQLHHQLSYFHGINSLQPNN
jgi:hypothetical protein